MSVAVSGLSGLTNAYRSVMSAEGSNAMAGASRWLDANAGPASAETATSPAAPAPISLRMDDMGVRPPRWGLVPRRSRRGAGAPGTDAADRRVRPVYAGRRWMDEWRPGIPVCVR